MVRIGEQGDWVYIGLRTENGNDADVVDDRLRRKEMTWARRESRVVTVTVCTGKGLSTGPMGV